jgi:hypothetical protein
MGLTRKLSEQLDLTSMTPQSDPASSGYCLTNPGKEYLIYIPREGDKETTLKLKPGTYSVEWINPSSGKRFELREHQSKTGEDIFVPPFNGAAILHLRKR